MNYDLVYLVRGLTNLGVKMASPYRNNFEKLVENRVLAPNAFKAGGKASAEHIARCTNAINDLSKEEVDFLIRIKLQCGGERAFDPDENGNFF